MSRAGLRRILKEQTAWQGVSRVLPAVREEFADGEHRRIQPSDEPEAMLWTGSFEDAVDASEAMLRKILREQFQHYGHTAFLLSGGLDSSLLTVLGAAERRSDDRMLCVSSVAPEGSGLPDERRFSSAVAEGAGISLTLVCPPAKRECVPATGQRLGAFTPCQSPAHGIMSIRPCSISPKRRVRDRLSMALRVSFRSRSGRRSAGKAHGCGGGAR